MATNLNDDLKAVQRDQFKPLLGKPITLREANQRYRIPRSNLLSWAGKGYIRVLRSGYRTELDEGDVAYCAALYQIRRKARSTKVPLLNPDGTPYLLKHPDLSAERRRRQSRK